jgi:hypothetical protein
MLMLGIAESADQGDKLAGKACPTDFIFPHQKGECQFNRSFFYIEKWRWHGNDSARWSGVKQIANNLQYVTYSDSMCQTN